MNSAWEWSCCTTFGKTKRRLGDSVVDHLCSINNNSVGFRIVCHFNLPSQCNLSHFTVGGALHACGNIRDRLVQNIVLALCNPMDSILNSVLLSYNFVYIFFVSPCPPYIFFVCHPWLGVYSIFFSKCLWFFFHSLLYLLILFF